MKKKLIDGLDCVLCGIPAQTLHHPNNCISQFDYFNDETQIPVCHFCHLTKCHYFRNIQKVYMRKGILLTKNENLTIG